VPATVPANLNLTINFPKDSVNVNESFFGQYIAENKGKPFKAYIISICRREGFVKECISKSIKDPFPGNNEWNRRFEQVLEPCEITESGADCVQESFKDPGTYTYEIKVYDCSQIERMGINCELSNNYSKINSSFSPIGTAERSIVVK
jgi:hypothetical protein